MPDLIDFSTCEKTNKSYGGANGKKIPIMYKNRLYMLKFPSVAKQHPSIGYSNSVFSEHIGCNIFKAIGLEAQNTILGKYKVGDLYKPVVACEDFAPYPWEPPYPFSTIKNRVLDSSNEGRDTDLSEILDAISKQDIFEYEDLLAHFWNVFVVDTLIGNWDRHNGNWGYLRNAETDCVKLAPIFDCGSSLYPQLSDEQMKELLVDTEQFKFRIYERPTSALRVNGGRINYYEFWNSVADRDAVKALHVILPMIDMNAIGKIIDNTPGISDVRKEFYCAILKARKEMILEHAERQIKRSIESPLKKLRANKEKIVDEKKSDKKHNMNLSEPML